MPRNDKGFKNVVRGFSPVLHDLEGSHYKKRVCLAMTKAGALQPFLPVIASVAKQSQAPLPPLDCFVAVFCSCLIHQAQLPNKLGNYILNYASQ